MLLILDGQASTYQEFAEWYYEKSLKPDAVEHIYRHEPLTNEVVAQLNNEITLDSLTADIEQIGYPRPIGPSSVT
jgi:hypothetical protein